MDHNGVELFDNREEDYLAWVQAHPQGFIANMDDNRNVPQYPMIHRASHKTMSSQKIGNFTTGGYVKYCSLDLGALERHLQKQHARPITFCSVCM
ncbi:hypothetical protein CMZ82_09570 [Lysobacteraceae bacterium NML93-0792]|nr:hypothetical protein CMZ82_09570 [Xanthomonadaceae bacterium NML93-0792]PBS15944.1 hypothetical protein CMZ81_08390 [Xanthomonadaceae bacterium NML93-0793]PBS18875.1 hypothetical protein CMZ80_09205 [Xanthomonadaceae bacterium NML93-0831]